MKIHAMYKHEDGNKVSFSLVRQDPQDPIYISFTPEDGEEFPFPNESNPVALDKILDMAMIGGA